MKLRDIIWTAVVAAVSGITGLVIAILGVSTDVVIALAGISVASALLAQREG